MATISEALYAAIATALGVDVTGVFQDEAPEGQAFPYVVFQQVAAPDSYTFRLRVKTVTLMQVTVWDEGHDKTRAQGLSDRIDAALTDQPLAGVTGHRQTRRDDSFSFTVRENGKSYPNVGGNYRITVST